MKAEEAEAAAGAAEGQAEASRVCADVIMYLIRDELIPAMALYGQAVESNGGNPPDWASEIQPYLLKYHLGGRENELFPGVVDQVMPPSSPSSESSPRPTASARALGKRRFEGTVEKMESVAVTKRAEAKILRAKAAESQALALQVSQQLATALPVSAHRVAPPPPAVPPDAADRPTLVTPTATRRIMKELNQLGRAAGSLMTVELPDESNCYAWQVAMKMDVATALGSELRDHAAVTGSPDAVLLEITFTGEYPSAPPFVRVVSPRFQFHTGHVTVGGSICLQELTKAAWKPALTMSGVLQMVQSAFISGDGHLDPYHAGTPYTADEAKRAFARVAQAHGWY